MLKTWVNVEKTRKGGDGLVITKDGANNDRKGYFDFRNLYVSFNITKRPFPY